MAKILILDPDPTQRRMLATILDLLGHTSIETDRADDAAQMIAVEPFDIVQTEWKLADRDGLWVLRQVAEQRRAGKKIAAVVVTDVANREVVFAAIEAGVGAFLLKSQINSRRLAAAIAQASASVRVAPPPSAEAAEAPALTPGSPDTEMATQPAPLPCRDTGQRSSTQRVDNAGATRLRELRPLLSRTEVLDRLREVEQVRAMSPTVTQVMRLTSNPSTSLAAISKVINRDQSISLKVLRMANSSIYMRGDPVTSIHDAVVRIGMQQIRDVVMGVELIDQFSTTIASEQFNFMHFWEHSIACGLIAAELGDLTHQLERERAFTLGLLHDVGRMVLLEHFAPEYAEVLATAARLSLPLEQVEARLLLLTHADIMERLLNMWGFPKDLVLPLANHHLSPSNLREHSARQLGETAVLALADRLAHAAFLGSSGNDTLYPTEGFVQLLKLSSEQIAQAVERAEEETHEVKHALLMVGQNRPWPAVLDRYKRELRTPLRPLYLTAEPGADMLGAAFARLGDGEGEPNLSIVRIDSARSAVALAARLRDEEQRQGVTKVPLLTISPAGDLALPGDVSAGRRCEKLPAPVTLSRVLTALNSMLGDAPPGALAPPASGRAA